jgi:hypothetical protein
MSGLLEVEWQEIEMEKEDQENLGTVRDWKQQTLSDFFKDV